MHPGQRSARWGALDHGRAGQRCCGRCAPQHTGPGEAVRIFTGAPLPYGADTVATQESVTRLKGSIRLERYPAIGKNICHAGEVASQGKIIVPAGRRLGPGGIGAAATGTAKVTVTRRPRVALLTTGNEIVPPGSPLAHAANWDANTSPLVAAIRAAGADVVSLEHGPDDLPTLSALIARVATKIDLLVTTRGYPSATKSTSGLLFGWHKASSPWPRLR